MKDEDKKRTLWCLVVLVVTLIAIIASLAVVRIVNKEQDTSLKAQNLSKTEGQEVITEPEQGTTEFLETVSLKENNELEKQVGAVNLYKSAQSINNDFLGESFELSTKYENIKLDEGDEEHTVKAREILNFDEVMDKVFSQNGKKQFLDSGNSLIRQVDNKIYLLDAARGLDETYWGTELILGASTDSRIEYIARAKYIDFIQLSNEQMDTLRKNPDEFKDMITFSDVNFTLVKENDTWLIEDFTNPN